MEVWGRIVSIRNNMVTMAVENVDELRHIARITNDPRPEAVLQVPDGRKISHVQRQKIYAILGDMASSTGDTKEAVKKDMKQRFCDDMGLKKFSFSTVDVTTATQFVTYLLEYCFEMDIPLKYGGMAVFDDDQAYQYMCLKKRKCVLCQKQAEVHHLDRVGSKMRHLVDHRELRLVALCHEHHTLAQKMSMEVFEQTYFLSGIRLDEETLIDLRIMTRKRMDEIDRRKERDDQSRSISRTTN